jgi:hypothetical protein
MMRVGALLLLLALGACAGQSIPAQDASGSPVTIDTGPTLEQTGVYTPQGVFIAVGVASMNPGAVGGLGLCGGD